MMHLKASKDVKVHIGSSMRNAADRILVDIARFEQGETVNERHITFENWQSLFSVLTPKR